MSTELKSITGRIEIPDAETRTSSYRTTNLLITSFSDGPKNGTMLQLTIAASGGHIQLTREEVRDLCSTLRKWL